MTRPDSSHLYDSRMCRNSSIDRLCKHPTAGLFRPATMATRVPEGGFHSTRKLGAPDECQTEALTNAKDGQLRGRFGPCGVARASSPPSWLFWNFKILDRLHCSLRLWCTTAVSQAQDISSRLLESDLHNLTVRSTSSA